MRIEQSIKDFYQFLCEPKFNYKSNQPESYKNITLMFLMLFVFEIVLAQILFAIIKLDDSSHKLTELFEAYPMYGIFIIAVILAPLIEEFLFRGFLRYPTSLLGIICLIAVGITMSFWKQQFIGGIAAGVICAILIIALIFISYNDSLASKASTLFKRYFGVVFYGSVVVFAYVHIFNFSQIDAWYLTPILVLPQFILALFLGYVRVRNNIWASIYVHALNNAIPTSLLLFFPDMAG